MNRKIGAVSSIINLLAVLGFAVSMLFGFDYGSYDFSMCIACSFVPMMCCFLQFAAPARRAAGYAAAAFAAAYAAIILLVYFAQLTSVRFGALTEQARNLLDFKRMGLFFYFDLLGYALMALATFFAGLTICPKNRADSRLRALLLIHGVFFLSCLLFPLLDIFQADSPAWIGTAVLEIWCAYFTPIAGLSYSYFRRKEDPAPRT